MGAFALPRLSQKRVAEHARHDVRLKGGLVLLPKEVTVDGLILNVSEGGCLFRPLQTHLLNRTGDHVMLAFRGHRLAGRIMSTNQRGYGVAFERLVDVNWFLRT